MVPTGTASAGRQNSANTAKHHERITSITFTTER